MATLYFTNSQIIILRSRVKSGDIVSVSATFTTMPADIQPASPERVEFLNGSPGHVFTAFVSTDHLIKEGDRLITMNQNGSRNKTYEVRGVNYWQGAGLLDHQELTIVDEVA